MPDICAKYTPLIMITFVLEIYCLQMLFIFLRLNLLGNITSYCFAVLSIIIGFLTMTYFKLILNCEPFILSNNY
ncbi:hypothetical protein crov385 [Cafeteria roenbergensis virus]|uniref:Uncharacterized protein n=1 Tax=Cafeteria roenbergensis virus (strain BV-PW1) TaxID=693272 RepID=E3T5F6_CROVB|nr:hypothetical protein crov385 [Cafeteria roenbergensis virus BV-PW1]ADO67419.1 hypothetical protein crov385 [Cafeteria roenbergensis virus BV-PW1]